MLPLSEVVADALQNHFFHTLERNIVNGLQALQDQMKDVNVHESYLISFDRKGLLLQRVITGDVIVLPPEDVVKELLDLK